MAVIYILLPLAILLAAGALIAFMRAVSMGQFDDLDTPPHRILHDDEDAVRHEGGHSAHDAAEKHRQR